MQFPPFPKSLASVLARLPALPTSLGLVGLLNLVAWKALQELDWEAFHGRRFCVHVRDTGLRAYFSLGDRGFVTEWDEQAEVTFAASAEDFLRLALRLEDPDTLFFNRRLLIEGDTDLGLRAKNMLDAVELEAVTASMPAGLGRVLLRLREGLADSP